MFFSQARHFLLLLILGLLPFISNAQNPQTYSALDNRLYNGKIYSYYPPSNVIGNQFLSKPDFSMGSVWLDGVEYRNITLNYDIVNQQLLISFYNMPGAERIIAISMAYLDSFSFEGKKFIIQRDSLNNASIYQVLAVSGYRFYIFWYKTLNLRTSLSMIQYEFSKSMRNTYYQHIEPRFEVNRNKKFWKLFPKNQAVLIRKYMRAHKMKIGKMSDIQYGALLVFLKDMDHA